MKILEFRVSFICFGFRALDFLHSMSLLTVAISAAKKAGDITLRYFETSVAREVKTDKSFVTAADREAEGAIIAEIKKYFPAHGIIGEESGEEKSASEFQWVIDPLDGTANFVNGIPLFSVSIAVLKNGAPVTAAVYQPIGDSLYAAEKGRGTTWKGTQVCVSDGGTEHAMISFGPGKKEKERLNRLFGRAEQFVKSKRYLGSCALELAYLARGGTEGFICFGLNKWDYAAGVLLVEEAGGKITDFNGKPWCFGVDDYFIASNGKIHNELLSLAKTAKQKFFQRLSRLIRCIGSHSPFPTRFAREARRVSEARREQRVRETRDLMNQ
jgi:myo-inositol-1(or 4)-monophosphatase